ncbi:hypothetical protein [Aquimarina algiphila]|uniref:hypothetical protein n=1 Tax=Aquimarina algiphila TaxID=2047982 RepID=UPI002330FF2C|nr:hypothetical protein [Aquimarina algiphila]
MRKVIAILYLIGCTVQLTFGQRSIGVNTRFIDLPPLTSTQVLGLDINGSPGIVTLPANEALETGWVKSGTTTLTNQSLVTLVDSDLLLDSPNLKSLIIKRQGTIGTGNHINPVFRIGDIEGTGIGEPSLFFRYVDEGSTSNEYQNNLITFGVAEPSGTWASVRRVVGSHFEGFIDGDSEPFFRGESIESVDGTQKSFRFRMGSGGNTPNDVSIERGLVPTGQQAPFLFVLGGSPKMFIYPDSVFLPGGVFLVMQDNNFEVVKLYPKNGSYVEEHNGVVTPISLYKPPMESTTTLAALPQSNLNDGETRLIKASSTMYWYDSNESGAADASWIAPNDQASTTGYWKPVN